MMAQRRLLARLPSPESGDVPDPHGVLLALFRSLADDMDVLCTLAVAVAEIRATVSTAPPTPCLDDLTWLRQTIH